MSMTPERIEEIKRILENGRSVHLGREEIHDLLAALEEAQQQITELRRIGNGAVREQEYSKQQAGKWNDEAVRLRMELKEARETVDIADRNARAAIDGYMEKELAALQVISTLSGQLVEAQQTIAWQREALEFYAKKEHWELPHFGKGHSRITSDGGSKARELLEEGGQS